MASVNDTLSGGPTAPVSSAESRGEPLPAIPAPRPNGRGGADPALVGLGCCVFAAVGYTVVNVLLRDLAVRCHPVWILFIKESVTVAVIGPWLAWHARGGQKVLPGWRVLAALAAAGLATQLVGNLLAIWAFSRVGLAVAVPVMSGVNLVASATLGWIFLKERVSRQSAVAIALLVASVVLVSQGAPAANRSIAATAPVPNDPRTAALAVLGACVAGVVYAVLSVVIRRNVTVSTRPSAVVFMITVMGTLSLAPVGLLFAGGVDELAAMAPADVGRTLAAGVLNLLAFVALTWGLQLTPVARVNVLTASQVAMGAVAGMLLFAEPASPWLALGVCATLAGMILIGRRDDVPETPETPI
ncbi:MAG: DMT family transporter [Pirellulales bacterium]|nr:DMT family transporter [Pirellulales bacterium]